MGTSVPHVRISQSTGARVGTDRQTLDPDLVAYDDDTVWVPYIVEQTPAHDARTQVVESSAAAVPWPFVPGATSYTISHSVRYKSSQSIEDDKVSGIEQLPPLTYSALKEAFEALHALYEYCNALRILGGHADQDIISTARANPITADDFQKWIERSDLPTRPLTDAQFRNLLRKQSP